jgi:hypothetical protein
MSFMDTPEIFDLDSAWEKRVRSSALLVTARIPPRQREGNTGAHRQGGKSKPVVQPMAGAMVADGRMNLAC